MESTIIENEMLDELAEELGLRDEIAGITARAMRGELDFEAAVKARVAMLAGLEEAALARAEARIRVMPGAAALVATVPPQPGTGHASPGPGHAPPAAGAAAAGRSPRSASATHLGHGETATIGSPVQFSQSRSSRSPKG